MTTFDWGKDYAQVGGKYVSALDAADKYGVLTKPYLDFGAMPRFAWGEATEAMAHEAEAQMPKFEITGATDPSEKKVCLFDLWKHPETVSAIGFEFPGFKQLTGSCVGVGGGNVVFTLICMEAIRLRDAQQIVIPFWPFTYGRGRYHSGSRSPGEGSSGTGQSRASREDGHVESTRPGLPKMSNSDMLVLPSSVEISWSDGDSQQSLALLPEARKNLAKTTAKLRSSDDVRAAIRDGKYPVTQASMYGFSPRVEGEGQDAVLIGRRGPRWSHQMSIQAWWEHPKFGELFWMMNQWGLRAHGTDPSGGPAGGVWIPKADVDWLIRDGDECFAYSQFDGFPAQTFIWGAY